MNSQLTFNSDNNHGFFQIITDDIYVEFKSTHKYKTPELHEWLNKQFDAYAQGIYNELASKPTLDDSAHKLSYQLPGIKLRVKHPVNGVMADLHSIIIDLNDSAQKDKGRAWTREEIADWIESTCDLESITFQPPEVTNNEESLFEASCLVKIQRILPL